MKVAPVANLWQRQYMSREQYLCLLGHQSSNLSRMAPEVMEQLHGYDFKTYVIVDDIDPQVDHPPLPHWKRSFFCAAYCIIYYQNKMKIWS
nr:hypothetical protein Iba_chr10aCG10440 [Ipomoea batatas]